jgi:hypothetical protein
MRSISIKRSDNLDSLFDSWVLKTFNIGLDFFITLRKLFLREKFKKDRYRNNK